MRRTRTARLGPWSGLWLVAALAGCSALGEHQERKIPQLGCIDPNQPRELEMVSLPPYVVEPPDELEVAVRPTTVLEGPSVTTVTVRPDGVIDLGFAGEVYVAGLTIQEVELKVAQHLAAYAARRGVREPVQADVRLINGSQSKVYYVLDTVTSPGSFPITGNETVVDAILRAGLRSNSLPEKAYLVRPHPPGGPPQVLKIDWVGITQRGDSLTNYQVFPGDKIIVPGGKPPGLFSVLFGGS